MLPLPDNGHIMVRGLVNPLLCETLNDIIRPHVGNLDSYANKLRGTIHYRSISPRLFSLVLTPEIQDTFHKYLGRYTILDNKQQSVVLLAGSHLRGTIWHQEAATVPEDSMICWVNLTAEAGAVMPGLQMVGKRFTEIVPTFFNDYAEESAEKEDEMPKTGWPISSPVFGIGDGVFFDRYTIHRTFIPKDVGGTRVSFKITAKSV